MTVVLRSLTVPSSLVKPCKMPWTTIWHSYHMICHPCILFFVCSLTCRKIHLSKSVGVTPHLPFIAAILKWATAAICDLFKHWWVLILSLSSPSSCSLWTAYGTIKPDSTIILVNTVGLILQLSYVTIYHTYAENKASHLYLHADVAWGWAAAVVYLSSQLRIHVLIY